MCTIWNCVQVGTRWWVAGTAIGDVREILEILPGAVPEPVTVQCVDRI